MLLQGNPMNTSSSTQQYVKCQFCLGNYGIHVGSCGCSDFHTTMISNNNASSSALQMSEEEETWLVQTLTTVDDATNTITSMGQQNTENTNMNVVNYYQIDDATNDVSQVGDFLNELAYYLENDSTKNIPFDYIDLWVPVLDESKMMDGMDNMKLSYAGHTVLENTVNKHNKNGFGKYSMLFSFEPGHGIPGRVYSTGSPIWESDLPSCTYFERSYGAKKYGINTCLGLPINSTIGRIVVLFYTELQLSHRDEAVIHKLQKIIVNNWNPYPRWKLSLESGINDATIIPLKASPSTSPNFKPVSDINTQPVSQPSISTDKDLSKQQSSSKTSSPPSDKAIKEKNLATQSANDKYIDFQIANLLAEQMPIDNSPLTSGFVSLRLLLLRSVHTDQESDMLTMLRKSYHGYKVVQRLTKDIALLLVQDFMFLKTVFAKSEANDTDSEITLPRSNNTTGAVRSVSYDVSISGSSTPSNNNNPIDSLSTSSTTRKNSSASSIKDYSSTSP